MSDFNFFIPIAKAEKQKDGSVLVSGYASTPSLDLDGEIVSLNAVKKALPGYWEWRNIREMHQPKAIGVGKEANVDATGLFLTSRITDRDAAQKCLDEVYKGYSIGGRKLAKNGNTITEIELVEISLVDRPANPDCRISVAKRAKDAKQTGAEAYLVKPVAVSNPKNKALVKMAKAIELMAKGEEELEKDGFSRPMPGPNRSPKDDTVQNNKSAGEEEKCAEHGVVGCEDCLDKISPEARSRAKEEDKTQPGKGERFPIRNKDDLGRAHRAIGRSKTPDKTRLWIRTRARDLGVKLPDKWKKKEVRKLIKAAEEKTEKKKSVSVPQELDFLDITKQGNFSAPLLEEPEEFLENQLENYDMTELAVSTGSDDLDTALLNVLKRAAEPSRAKRVSMAQENLRKAARARKEAREAIKECHASVSKRYMAKLHKAKKPEKDDDDDEMGETEKLLKSLQKAYSSLTTMKTFIKAADSHLEKAVARAGQRGQETNDPSSSGTPINKPTGLEDLSPGEMYNAGVKVDGELAKFADRNGMVPAAVAEIMAKNAKLESEVAILGRVGNSSGPRPYAFDVSKAYGVDPAPQSDSRKKSEIIFQGVNPNDLQSQDENVRNRAAATTAGNYLLAPSFGKSIVDPNFRGKAGMGRGA